MNAQLVAMEYEGDIHYGELSDAHIFRGTERRILLEDVAYIPMPAVWKAHLDHLPHINIERADGSWGQSFLWGHGRALQTAKGYIIPIMELHYRVGAKAFPKMLRRCELQPPIQGQVPPPMVRSDPKPAPASSKHMAASMHEPAKTKSIPKKSKVKFYTESAKPYIAISRRSSVSSTDAVSEKVLTPQIRTVVRLCRDSMSSTGAVCDTRGDISPLSNPLQ